MAKKFKLPVETFKPLAKGFGGCIATDMITVEGFPVGFMYREEPANEMDSGWRFMSGHESDEYMENSANHEVYDVNTIANCDESIIPFLDAPIGSVFEKTSNSKTFVAVTDWHIPE